MRKTFSLIRAILLVAIIAVSGLLRFQTQADAAAVSPWWNPDITPKAASELYCAANPGLGHGTSAIIPREGIVLTTDQWTNVTLRGVGCGGAGEHQVTLYGQTFIGGVGLIDFSQSGYENVTSRTDVNSAGGTRLVGDELWMFDTGIGDSDGFQGHDTTLRVNRSFFTASGPYSIPLSGMGWFMPPGCPNPVHYTDIGANSNCAWAGVNRTNQATSNFDVLVEVQPPIGEIEKVALGPSGVVGQACSSVSGWTDDPDDPNSALTIKVYTQTGDANHPTLTEVYSATADGTRTDAHTGHGFTIPAEVLNQYVTAANPTTTFVVKALGIIQDGSPIGDPDGILIGSTDVSVCQAPAPIPVVSAPKTGKIVVASLITAVLIGGIGTVATIFIRKSHKQRPSTH